MPSTDPRFPDASGDIWQHGINNYDWEDDWIFSDVRFRLDEDEPLLRFLCETVHPEAIADNATRQELLSAYNRLLAPDGYEIVEVERISGRPVFGYQCHPPGPLLSADIISSAAYSDLWLSDHLRAFLSHVSGERAFVEDTNQELRGIGIHGFVAHTSIEPDEEWQGQIERALMSCDAFVALLHPGFASSYWTHQEVGWALGRGVPVQMIRLGEDPVGFPARTQARTPSVNTAWGVASAIAVGLAKNPALGEKVINNLTSALRTAASYVDGRNAAERLEEMGRLSDPVLDAIADAYLSNDQLYPNHVGARVLRRVFLAHGRALPMRS